MRWQVKLGRGNGWKTQLGDASSHAMRLFGDSIFIRPRHNT